MRETKVEKHLVKVVEALGGTCEKHVSPGKRFVPDRLICWPRGYYVNHGVEFVETKAPGKRPNSGQLRDHQRRRDAGFTVSVLDTIEKVDAWAWTRGMK